MHKCAICSLSFLFVRNFNYFFLSIFLHPRVPSLTWVCFARVQSFLYKERTNIKWTYLCAHICRRIRGEVSWKRNARGALKNRVGYRPTRQWTKRKRFTYMCTRNTREPLHSSEESSVKKASCLAFRRNDEGKFLFDLRTLSLLRLFCIVSQHFWDRKLSIWTIAKRFAILCVLRTTSKWMDIWDRSKMLESEQRIQRRTSQLLFFNETKIKPWNSERGNIFEILFIQKYRSSLISSSFTLLRMLL